MKKQTIAQRIIILMTTGFVTQIILSMINQIVVTRLLAQEGMRIYVLILPTLTLLSTIANIGFSTAIPNLISKANAQQKKALFVVFIMAMLSNTMISVIYFIAARPLAIILLRDDRTYLPLLSIIPLLFCISLSSILKVYFQSKQLLTPPAAATILSQIVRIFASFFFISTASSHGIIYGVAAVIWSAITAELVSILVLLIIFFNYTYQNYSKTYLKPTLFNFQILKDAFKASLPTTGNSLVVAFTQFLEPIIVVQSLFKIGYTSELSTNLYSAVSGFTLPILLMPSFISQSITQSIIPSINQAYKKDNFKLIHHYLNSIFKVSFFTGGLYTVLVMLFPIKMMDLVFNTSTGSEYLLIMAPFFLFFFFQPLLTATLQNVGRAKLAMKTSFISSIIKISLMLILLPNPRLNIQGLVIAIIIHTMTLALWHFLLIKDQVNYQTNFHSVINGILIIGITYLTGYYLQSIVIVTTHAILNMFIHIIVISLIYLVLVSICGLLPKKTIKI